MSEFAKVVANWAAAKPDVKAAYLYGSRVKGTESPSSDIDVAIVLDGDDEGFANWICGAGDMRSALSPLLPVPLDLQMMHSGDAIVMPAVLDHGVLVYERLQP